MNTPPQETHNPRLLTIEDIYAMPDPTWLVEGVVPGNALTLLYGDTTAYKSFLALDWALHVATSQHDWYGHAIQHGPVAYLAGEGLEGYKHRLLAWEQHHDTRLRGAPFRLCDHAIHLWDSASVAALCAALHDLRPALVVVDTVSRAMVGKDENKELDLAVEGADRIRRATGAAVLLIHHTPRSGKTPRGGTALPDGSDAVVLAERDKADLAVTLTCTKQKDAAAPPPLHVHLTEVALPDRQTSLVVTAVEATAAKAPGHRKNGQPRQRGGRTTTRIAEEQAQAALHAGMRLADYATTLGLTEGAARKWVERLGYRCDNGTIVARQPALSQAA